MVEIVLEKLFKVLQDARVKVTESGYIPGQAFPTEQAQLDALANVLENTALFGDILLRLPGITHEVYRKSKEWELLARWSVSFCNETKVYDDTDSKLLLLMAQELRLVPRDPNYINPYRKKAKKEQKNKENSEQESISKKSKKKKEKKKRGPRLSHAEL
ncbi:coiled-coil domain-containing protein 134-like isoform X2 [Porites lutea]